MEANQSSIGINSAKGLGLIRDSSPTAQNDRDRKLALNPLCAGRRAVRYWLLAVLLALAYAFPPTPAEASCQEPVYVITHRCNDANDGPDAAMFEGVNAIEADFSWGSRCCLDADFADEWAVDHDGVFPASTSLDDWLNDVKGELNRTNPRSPLSLIILDIKDPDGPLVSLYNQVRGALGPEINLLFSTASFDNREHLLQLKDAINNDDRAGLAFDELDEADDLHRQHHIKNWFEQNGITKFWYGDGINAVTVTPDSVREYVDDGMALRDANTQCDAFHGVYTWTYETEGSYAEFLLKGVNGIMVNSDHCSGCAASQIFPFIDTCTDASRAVEIAKTLPGRKYATREDNPFKYLPVEITCPPDVTVECKNGIGYPDPNDPVLQSFLDGATSPQDDGVLCNNPNFSDHFHFTSDPFAALLCKVNQSCDVLFSVSAPHGNCDHADVDGDGVPLFCLGTVTVQDTIPPSMIACPADQVVSCTSAAGAVVNYDTPTATDACGVTSSKCLLPSGSTFQIQTTVNPCVVTDLGGNTAGCAFSVTVQDTTPPTIVCPADIAVDPVGPQGTVVSFDATVTDICDDSPSVVCPASGNTFGVGTETVVTCTATDAGNNQDSCNLTVKVYSPQEVVANLDAAAAALNGSLTPGQVASLRSKLSAILKKIEQGNTPAICGQLQSFITKVNAWVAAGILTPAEAQPLIQSATNLSNTFGC